MRNAKEMEIKNRALSESEARYRQSTEGSLDAIVVADARAGIDLFNPAAEKIFGYESGEVLGQPLDQLIPGVYAPLPQISGASVRGVRRCRRRGGRWRRAESPAHRRSPRTHAGDSSAPRPSWARPWSSRAGRRIGTEFPLELSLNAVEMNGRTQYIGSIRDQTERQRMQRDAGPVRQARLHRPAQARASRTRSIIPWLTCRITWSCCSAKPRA